MTLTLELEPEEAAILETRAKSQGMELEQFARMMLGLVTPLPVYSTNEELEVMFDELARGMENLPVLPPEAYDRENLYEDRM